MRWRVLKTSYGEWLAMRQDYDPLTGKYQGLRESFLRPTWCEAYDIAYNQSRPLCVGCGGDLRLGLHGLGSCV